MKVFAIITASLMAVAGGVYFYSTESGCSGAKCGGYPVAKTGGCCDKATGEVSTEIPTCCAKLDDCCLTNAACCTTASVAKANTPCCFPGAACCEAGLPCCVTAACCTVTSMTVVAKPKEIAGCCDEGCCVTTTVKHAAKSIASVK